MAQPVLGGSSAEIQKVGFFFGWLVVCCFGFFVKLFGRFLLLLLFGFPFSNQNFTPPLFLLFQPNVVTNPCLIFH